MPDLKISQLPAASALAGTEALPVVQEGANKRATPAAIKSFIGDAAPTGANQNDGLLTHEDKAKLDGIEAGADVTDATNVAAAGAVMTADVDDSPVDGATTAPISSNWAYDHSILLATETDNRVLADQQLAGGVAFATDLAGQAVRGLATAAAASLSAAQGAVATETDNRVLYDEELTRAVTYATDLAGQAARTLSGSLPSNVPASASAPGVAGQMRYASGYLYVCVASNTWQRVAIATWQP